MDLRTILTYFDVKHGPKGQEGYYEARCPVHDDKKASLIIGPGETGVRVKCLANCATEDVLAAVGLTMKNLFYDEKAKQDAPAAPKQRKAPAPKPVADKPADEAPKVPKKVECVYPYTDENGAVLFEVVRYVPKDFRQRVPDPTAKGGYRWSIKGVRPVIYKLPIVLDAIKQGKPIFIVEGEKDADSLAQIGAVGTTSPMGAGKWRSEHSDFLAGADVYILPDNDEPGRKHAEQVSAFLVQKARNVYVLDLARACPQLPEKGDISDMMELLGRGEAAKALRRLMDQAVPIQVAPYERAKSLYEDVQGYGVMDGGIVAYGKESVRRLSTFVALPTKIITKTDGMGEEIQFQIAGWDRYGHEMKDAIVNAEDFPGMGWVLKNWGFDANIMPGNAAKDQLRFVVSEVGHRNATRETVYAHIGWRQIKGKWVYLHRGGAIGMNGVRVELESSLERYTFENDLDDDPLVTIALAHEFKGCMARHISIPLLGMVFLAPLREFITRAGHMPRMALWIKGPGGAHKSTATSLAMSFFGRFDYSDPLPASFQDTITDIRAKAFTMKDSILAVDDFHPVTSQQERKKMESVAELLSRAYGNGADRGRRNSDLTAREARPPRGLAICTGELTPDISPSAVARFYMIDVDKGDIEITPELELVQQLARKGYMRKAMYDYITWLSGRVDGLMDELPEGYVRLRKQAIAEGGDAHGRSAEAVAHIMLGYEMMLRYMVDIGAMQPSAADAEIKEAWGVIMANSKQQTEEAKEDSPVSTFVAAVVELLNSKQASVHDISTPNPEATLPNMIGYVDQQYYYLLPDVAFARVCRLFTDQGTTFPLNKRALWKMLKDAGYTVPDNEGKSTRLLRVGSRPVRLLWLKRGMVEGTVKITTATGEQLTMTAVDDAENPF